MQNALNGLKFCMCFIGVDIAETIIKPSCLGSSSGCTCCRGLLS